MSINRRLAVVATALGTTAGLLTGATAGSAQAGTESGQERQTVEVVVKRDHTVVMPDEIRPGVSKFRISSRRAAGFQILQAAPGYTKRQAVHDINNAFMKNNLRLLKRFEAHTTFYGGMPSRRDKPASMWVDLPEGTYWAVDTQPQRTRARDVKTFHVAGEPVYGELSGQEIVAIGETSWAKRTQHITSRGKIWFKNESTDNHFLEIVRLAPGKTMTDFRRWIRRAKRGIQERPPVVFRGSIDTGVVSPGESMTFRYHLRPGSYVMICWWPDAEMGGMPHAFMGMVRGLQVD